jgi:PST family polysaccharide transporter
MSRDPEPPGRSLGSSAAHGAVVTLTGQVARVGIQLGGIVVLARLLTPSDYGLLTMVLAIVGVGEVFRDFGLSTAAIQAKTLSRAQRTNLFWINTFIGLALSAAVLAASHPIALLFDEPRLEPIAAVLSSTFLLNGIATQYKADLTRQLRFSRLAVIEVVAVSTGLVTGIAFALLDYSYWALVAQQVATPAAMLLLVVTATRWLPGWVDRDVPMRSFLQFGANLLAVQLLTYISRNTDSVIIGARFGPAQLGIYDRAFQLLVLPLNQINAPASRVALPVLSRLQGDTQRFGMFLLRGQSVLVHLMTALFALAAAQAAPGIRLILGEQWSGSVIVFQVLALGGVMQALSYATYWVFLSHGLASSNLRFALLTRPFVVVALLVGSTWGIVGVAAGYSLSLLVTWPLGIWWVSRITDVPALRMFFNGARALLGYGFAGVCSFLSTAWLADVSTLVELAVGVAAFAAAFLVLVLVWPRFRLDVQHILRIRSIVKGGTDGR